MASCGLVYPATVEVGGAEVAERLSLGVPVAQFAENSQISLQTLDRLVVLGQLTVSAAEDAQRDALAIALADLPLDPKRCTGQKCKQYERCFLTLMHQRAQASDIVIVNHHLFFADLALKEVLEDGDTEGGILHEYQ